MSSIDGVGGPGISQGQHQTKGDSGRASGSDEGGFRSTMSRVASGAASGVSKVASAVPGGAMVNLAAEGLSGLRDSSPDTMPGAGDDQMSEMFEMQKQSQAFNLQYLELQTRLQEDNRHFSTLTNLMKVRHDTAKAAINNMHA